MSESHKKIAVLTLPIDANYGGVIQSWALSQFLEQQGYDVTVLNRRWNASGTSWVKTVLRWVFFYIYLYPFTRFVRHNIHLSPVLRDSVSIKQYVEKEGFSAVVVGSDQVWRIENVRGADLNFFLDFITDNNEIKKISYAASFGSDEWKGKEEETVKITNLLHQFNFISVREDSGVTMCSERFDVDATSVLDPTMLLSGDEYRKVAKINKVKPHGVVTYILDNNAWKQQYVNTVVERLGSEEISLYPKQTKLYTKYRTIENWIKCIADAEYVVVDSFHGMVFSILFNKQFTVIANVRRGLTRFTSLLPKLGLMERLVYDGDTIDTSLVESTIDYGVVNENLKSLKEKSSSLLLNALEE